MNALSVRGVAILTWLAVSAALIGLAGCLAVAAGAAAGAGTYAYVNGEMTTREDASLDRVWIAARGAVEDLQLITKDETKDELQAKISAERADGTSVTIKLDSEGADVTKIGVRVGVFGDRSQSRVILDKIRERL